MNRLAISCAVLSLFNLTTAHAQWYGGMGLGINSVAVNKTLHYPIGGALVSTNHYDAAYTGFHGQLFAGKGFQIKNKAGIAIEGDVEWFNGNSEHGINNFFYTTNANAREKLRYGFGLYLLPEFKLNDATKLFVGPGISTTRFSIGSGETAGNEGISGQYSQWLDSYGFKGGLRSQLNEQVDVHLTYQYNQFKNSQKSAIEPLSGDTVLGNYRPYGNTIMLGLRYNV